MTNEHKKLNRPPVDRAIKSGEAVNRGRANTGDIISKPKYLRDYAQGDTKPDHRPRHD